MEGVLPTDKNICANRFANLILDVCVALLESGAHCERIHRNVQRLSKPLNFKVDLFMSFTAISATVTDMDDPYNTSTRNRRIAHLGTHFGVLTGMSLLTWDFCDHPTNIDDLENRLNVVRQNPRHNVWLVRFFIGVACACLCLLAGGDWVDGCFTFFASAIGLIVRQELVQRHFNVMIAVMSSAFVTTCISGLDMLLSAGASPEKAVATAVLFLIPGVPLINCIIDLFEGYIPTAIARGAFGGFVLLCIAIGMFLGMMAIGIDNF